MTWIPPDGPGATDRPAWGAPDPSDAGTADAPAAGTGGRMPHPVTDRPPGARRLLDRRRLLVVALVLALGAGGVWGGLRWQATRERDRLEQALRRVHADYRAGACSAAAAGYRAAVHPQNLPELDRRARADLGLCRGLEQARAVPAAGDRAVAYLDFLRGRPGAPLDGIARRELVRVLQQPVADLATEQLCRRNDELESGALTPAQRAGSMPRLLLGCGTAGGTDGRLAEFYLHQLLADYPDSAEVAGATRSLAALVIGGQPESERRGFGGIGRLRTASSLGGRAELLVYNQGPRELEVAALGPDAAVATVGGCAGCRPYYGPDVAVACTWTGTPARLVLPAGDYRLAVRYAAGGSRSGTLTLAAGTVYRTCVWQVGTIG
jgi:hypothetical protein